MSSILVDGSDHGTREVARGPLDSRRSTRENSAAKLHDPHRKWNWELYEKQGENIRGDEKQRKRFYT
jgi:hypothetical protein